MNVRLNYAFNTAKRGKETFALNYRNWHLSIFCGSSLCSSVLLKWNWK